ncbi:acetoin utilization AcuB family protein [Paenisporosarcina sp. OV554]|uniref:acetoin utilization AcuB family protein n=1 Tax=Paenisporosarcina sp. OV554 TaxID=2135694 RepID=UPI000D3CB9A0|nr:acetoin utilization AcuB family protein [Paenisporosarcina sp. OV554]PUB15248.1 acetoin utilization protein AcuB [Paenisporosarcina sp. OV554]
MIVEQMMNTNILTLQPTHSIKDAINLLLENKIRHLPITNKKGHVVGVLSDRDIKDATPSNLIDNQQHDIYATPIEEIMTKNPLIGHPLDFVEEVATIFYDQKIGCLPIVSSGKLVGIITETDLLYKYIELTGAHQPGSQIEVRVPNKPGILFEVSKVFHDHQSNVLSVLVYPDLQNDENKILVFRVKTMNPLGIIEDIRKEGFDVLWPNMPGMTT